MTHKHSNIDLSKLNSRERKLVELWRKDSEALRYAFDSPDAFTWEMLYIVGKTFINALSSDEGEYHDDDLRRLQCTWYHIGALIEQVKQNPVK
jgi:hypothetical protein